MFWQEDEDKTLPYQAPDDILDLSFAMRCKQLPLDHAWDLSVAIHQALPWFEGETLAGVHTIHVAESGNGWLRPEEQNGLLIPSRRTRLELRIPKQRIQAAQALTGQILSWGEYKLEVGEAKEKPFSNAAVLFARYVVSAETESEKEFLQRMAAEVKQIAQFKIKKMLCGRSQHLRVGTNSIFTRHLMLADLDNETSIRLQQVGLGVGRHYGCGLLLPHKGIKTLKPTE
ncbi:type I-MYXAN CRISPR-associated protein Cas6/Cmx6 [uncultured Thiothrix sp.]|uniref:type I-MYXAN CRISPR-associated protein Cas6/Cmx6 n=1 Tax=uncultured Thiothrix sp. TaxID=223185 RepID=UPI002608689A|nr:type I-MYXAN CRISPR-associated protein Cas6/Cmx6 [uncultured Thiothrix sp.]HMT91783.1 type I-MYXAN CRISPR-associated protein Cas6/Cmx6 [Thiolinea sp.]